MNAYFDSHVHLASEEFSEDIDEVIERARDKGVQKFLVPGGDMEENRRVLDLGQRFQDVFAAVGIHPNTLAGQSADWKTELQRMVASGGIHAIGETGLDLYRKRTSLEEQVRSLYYHLELGAEYGLPVIVHQRAAADELVKALREFSLKGGAIRGVLHCFGGTCEYLENMMAYDFFISFAGPITYPRNRKLREIVSDVPENRLLIETDAPYLPPQSHRGKRNEPAYITEVATKVAESLRLMPSDVARITYRNAHHLLKLPIPDDEPSVVYEIRNSLYINLTNRCNCGCVFCPASVERYEIRGHNLKLQTEPEPAEIIAAVRARLADGGYKEVVFCGLGEPTMRLNTLLDVAAALKGTVPLRLDTNGLVALYEGPETAARIADAVDAVSVSLNTANPEQYREICRPGKEGAFQAVMDFVKTMRDAGVEVTITAVKYPGIDTGGVMETAKELGVRVKVRELVR